MTKKKTTETVTWAFLLAGVLLVGVLTYSKHLNSSEAAANWASYQLERSMLQPVIARPDLISTSVDLPSHSIYLSSQPVTNAQYSAFSQATGYQTWLETQKQTRTWKYPGKSKAQPSWQEDPSGPVRYLTRDDAKAFCMWLGRKEGWMSPHQKGSAGILWQQTGPRLPSVKELETAHEAQSVPMNDENWIWTHNRYGEEEGRRPSSITSYFTSWKPDGAQRHRRTRDMQVKDLSQSVFHVAWTMSDEQRSPPHGPSAG